jgi:hypothetical protein
MKQKIRQWFNKNYMSRADLLGLIEDNHKITNPDLIDLLVKKASVPAWKKYFDDVKKDLL